MLYLPSHNGHICSVYEIISYYLHTWSFCLVLKARQPRLHPSHDFFWRGFCLPFPWILWLLSVLSVYFYFAFHTNLRIGSDKSWLSRTQGSVVILFLFILLFHWCVAVCVCVWISFLSLSSCHSCGETYCVICEVSQSDLPQSNLYLWSFWCEVNKFLKWFPQSQ